MLTHTFCHVPGIGPTRERHLWEAGVCTWGDVDRASELPLSDTRGSLLRACLQESATRLGESDPGFFCETMPSSQHWRVFPDFRDRVAYLDIETTGLGAPGDYITTIVLYDGREIQHFVHGQNLADFAEAVAHYGLLVTYNGKTFDLPFIRSEFGIPMPQAHIDLRYVLASLGYRGGLKACERQLGIDRNELADVDGYFAVVLWRDYVRNGNGKALETLLAYNTLDVVDLEVLMVLAYNMKIRETPFSGELELPIPECPQNPFSADVETMRRLRGWM